MKEQEWVVLVCPKCGKERPVLKGATAWCQHTIQGYQMVAKS